LEPSERRFPERAGLKGGERTGPTPTDRGKPSSYHLVVDRYGIPLAVRPSAAKVRDSTQLIPLVDAIPPIIGPRGRRSTRGPWPPRAGGELAHPGDDRPGRRGYRGPHRRDRARASTERGPRAPRRPVAALT
jgi:hypothetical protein